ncbi:MAG TPA: cupin domain-containing protein [Verrucomicrobiae bacterium]|nr:cupin domain-containing protein [Verrucomicrobiae bacterium]
MTIAEIILLGPGEGKIASVLRDKYTFKAASQNTGGAYALWEIATPAAAAGPPPHIHEREDEAFYILEDELTFKISDRTVKAAAGTFAFAPRGIVHTFSNPGTKPTKALVIVSSAGFENALEEMAQVAPGGDQPPDMKKLLAIANKYGLKIVGSE